LVVPWKRTPPSREQPDLFADTTSDRTAVPAGAALDADTLVRTLYTREGAALVRLARLFTDDRNAAEDLVQEAFIRLHRTADRIRDPDKAAPYLRSILLNLARDHNRRGLMSLRHAEALTPAQSPEAPEDRVILDEQQTAVISALEDLPPRQRQCLLLRFYFDLSEREIGATLRISPNSVKTHCRRGMEALRRNLEVT
jgi:RNA polymerase sigma-70 factor (sigma-E family)